MRIIFAILVILLPLIGQGQIDLDQTKFITSALQLRTESDWIYSWHEVNKNGTRHFELKLYDNKFSDLSTLTFDYSPQTKIVSSFANDMYLYLYMRNGAKNLLIQVDKAGTKKNEIVINDALGATYPVFLKGVKNNVYLIRHEEEDKIGFVIQGFDADLKSVFSYNKKEEKGNVLLQNIEIGEQGIVGLYLHQKNAVAQPAYYTFGISLSGTLKSTQKLDVGNHFVPHLSQLSLDNGLILCASYGQGNGLLPDMPEGLEIIKVNSEGKIDYSHQILYSENSQELAVTKRIKPNGSQVPGIIPVEIVEDEEGVKIMAESYYYQKQKTMGNMMAGTNTKKNDNIDFYVMDFVLLSIDKKRVDIQRMSKPHRKMLFSGIPDLDLTGVYQICKRNRFFAYQFKHEHQIYYKGEHGPYASFNSMTNINSYESIDSRKYLGEAKKDYYASKELGYSSINGRIPSAEKKLWASGCFSFSDHYINNIT